MKKFAKLVPALAMLLVSATVLATSTFAWFSMNHTVTASNMTVTAKSDAFWLQIANEEGVSKDNSNKTEADAKTTAATIYPAKYNGTKGSDAWQYANSDSADDHTANAAGLKDVASANVAHYRLANTFKISLKDADSVQKAKDLKVATCKVTGASAFRDAIGIVVVCGENVQTIKATGQASGTAWSITDAQVLAGEVTTAETEVKVYVYIDGENSAVKSANLTEANLAGTAVELTFTVTAG